MGRQGGKTGGGSASRGAKLGHTPIAHSPAATTSPHAESVPSSKGAGPAPADTTATTSIAKLTLDVPLREFRPTPRPRRVPSTPFHFLRLPPEIRTEIYKYFFADEPHLAPYDVLDLGPDNYKRIHHKLRLMRVCRQIRHEATTLLYSSRGVRLFPTYPGKYFKSKKPLLARYKPHQRACLTVLELRLGPGWNAPPRGWVVNDALGLADCTSVRTLNVMVECDPSDNVFKGFRRSEGFYETFSKQLLADCLRGLPVVDTVQFDAYSSVSKLGPMMQGLLGVALEAGKMIRWGPERGWTGAVDEEEDANALRETDMLRAMSLLMLSASETRNGSGYPRITEDHISRY